MKEESKKPLAIVMGRNYTTRLTLVRAAGMVGCDVVVIRTSEGSVFFKPVDEKSKYVIETISIPQTPNVLIETINSFRKKRNKIILLPADDFAAGTIDLHLYELEKDFLMPHVNHAEGAVVQLMDKSHQKDLAQKAGLKVAKGWLAEYVDGKYHFPSDIIYPCFVKPNESLKDHLKSYMKKCDNEDELKKALAAFAGVYHAPVLIEEFRQIDDEYGVQGASFGNSSVFPSIVRKKDCREGLTATGELLPIEKYSFVREKLSKFLELTQFSGVFDVDLYVSGGEWYFNELNVRLGANGFALTYGVANVPGLFISYMLQGESSVENKAERFESFSFASENVLRNMYFDRIISYKQYKDDVKGAKVLSIPFPGDDGPWKELQKTEWFMPAYKCLKTMKKVLYYDVLALVRKCKQG